VDGRARRELGEVSLAKPKPRPKTKSRVFRNCKRDSAKFADEIFSCDHSARNRPVYFDCRMMMRIRTLKNHEAPAVAFIQTSGEHDHKRLKDKGLSTPVKQKIEAKDSPSGGSTARVMQRDLQVSLCGTWS
jgi:hypothetical protein